MKHELFIPVECQNGHRATWVIEINGLEVIHKGVLEEKECDCPKFKFGEGYRAIKDVPVAFKQNKV